MTGLEAIRVPPWAALRNRNYALFFTGATISQTGTWMQRIAQAWLVLQLGGSAVTLGTVTFLQFLPVLFLSLFSGAVADRAPKRKILIVTNCGFLLNSALLSALVLSGNIEIWHVYAFALVHGLCNAFDLPVRQAFLNEMVRPRELQSAVALNSSTMHLARLMGPGLAGLLIATVGLGPCFVLNTASFAALLVCLLAIGPGLLTNELRALPAPLAHHLREGVRYVGGAPTIWLTLTLVAIVTACGYNFQLVIPLLARYAFDVDATAFGLMNTCFGVGALVGAMFMAARAMPSVRSLLASAAIFACLLIGLGLAPDYGIGLLILVLLGAVGMAYNAGTTAVIQIESAPEMRARVLSIQVLLTDGLTPFASLWTGELADALGVRAALLFNACSCLIGVSIVGYLASRASRAPRMSPAGLRGPTP